MQNSVENRKITLQNLLHKSQMFNQYLQNQQNLKTILTFNQSRKHQILQFGKCHINLPQKIKLLPEPRYNCNKLMVLTKSKKQAQKIKQKYDYLQKIKQSQIVNLNPQRISPQTKINPQLGKSKRLQKSETRNSRLFTPQRCETPKKQVYASNNQFNSHFTSQISSVLQKQKQKKSYHKNRSNSAKVRPNMDFYMKLEVEKNNYNYEENRKIADQNNIQYEDSQDKNEQKQNSLRYITHQLEEQTNTKNEDEKYYSLNKKQITVDTEDQQPPLTYSSYFQKRPTSFSIKKHNFQSQTPTLLVNKNFQQSQEQQKKNQIIFRKELHKTYNRAFIPPPKISARAYAIYELKKQGIKQTGKIIHAFNGKMAQEVASLTKIMTCLIVLQLGQKYNFNLSQEFVEIGKFQSAITGTSAEIKPGQIYSIEQLLYGLMLPSGNDASLALGVWGGKVLFEREQKNSTSRTRDNSETSSPLIGERKLTKKDYIQRFVQEMNQKARSLQMTRTKYANTHGLVNSENKSSAIDIVLLCQYAINNEKFAKIVSTQKYTSQIKVNKRVIKSDSLIEQTNLNNLDIREVYYQNTHKLLQKRSNQYIGIKTGVTTAAGPCLASCIHNKEKDRKFIIVVLGCKSMSMRFKQTQILKRWLFKQENIPMKLKKVYVKNRSTSLKDDKSEIQSEIDEDQDLSCQDNCGD